MYSGLGVAPQLVIAGITVLGKLLPSLFRSTPDTTPYQAAQMGLTALVRGMVDQKTDFPYRRALDDLARGVWSIPEPAWSWTNPGPHILWAEFADPKVGTLRLVPEVPGWARRIVSALDTGIVLAPDGTVLSTTATVPGTLVQNAVAGASQASFLGGLPSWVMPVAAAGLVLALVRRKG